MLSDEPHCPAADTVEGGRFNKTGDLGSRLLSSVGGLTVRTLNSLGRSTHLAPSSISEHAILCDVARARKVIRWWFRDCSKSHRSMWRSNDSSDLTHDDSRGCNGCKR
jgi:hypothetical protein